MARFEPSLLLADSRCLLPPCVLLRQNTSVAQIRLGDFILMAKLLQP